MKKILFPTDFSETADNALEYALKIAEKNDAVLILFHTVHLPYYNSAMIVNVDNLLRENAEKLIQEQEEKIRAKGSKVNIEKVVVSGFAVDEIAAYAQDEQVDLVVMGTTGASGLEEVVLGSIAGSVIERCKAPILAVPGAAKYHGFRKIAYATDLKTDDYTELNQLIGFAMLFDAEIHLVHVIEDDDKYDNDTIDKYMKDRAAVIKYNNLTMHVIKEDDVLEGISEFVDEKHADLIAMTTHRRSFFTRIFNRSLTKKMAFHSEVPLLAFQA